MNFDLKRPCDQCPFRKVGGARVRPERAKEIAAAETFECHKTIDKGKDERQHCAGHLLFHLQRGTPTQMMRIAQRLGMFDPDALDYSIVDEIVDRPSQMAESVRPKRKAPRDFTDGAPELAPEGAGG